MSKVSPMCNFAYICTLLNDNIIVSHAIDEKRFVNNMRWQTWIDNDITLMGSEWDVIAYLATCMHVITKV